MRKAKFLRKMASASLISATALALPAAVYAATTGTVQGTIRDDAGKPLSGVNVYLEGTERTTVTNKSGYYVFTGVTPGTYTVRAELVTFTTASTPVTVVQDQTATTDISLVPEVVKTDVVVSVPTVRRTQTVPETTVSARREQLIKSQPVNLYQFTGLVFGVPGITPDASGYTHIRGSDSTQVGFQVDGISIIEPTTNTFATNIVSVGLKSANIYTGAADPSYGNATGGFINQVSMNGRDIRGSILEYTGGPGRGWDYQGGNLQYGNVFGKLDVYAASILFKNRFPDNTVVQSLNDSADGLAKVTYSLDPNNQITLFHQQGYEQYDYFQDIRGLTPAEIAAQDLKYERSRGTATNLGRYQQDHEDQGSALSYISYRRNFNPQSFLTYRLSRLSTYVEFHLENTGNVWQRRSSTQTTNQLDYSNQISPRYSVRVGAQYVDATTDYRLLQFVTGDWSDPDFNGVFGTTAGYQDRASQVAPKQTILYLANQIKPLGDNLTLDLGIRYGSQNNKLKVFDSYSTSYTDPRAGITYSPSRDLVFRSSYGINSEFPETRFIELLYPANGFTNPTAQKVGDPSLPLDDPANLGSQYRNMVRRYRQFNRLGTQHSANFDLGVEKGFDLLGGSWNASLTGFRRRQYGLMQYERINWNPLGGPRLFNNEGTGHVSGVEIVLGKRQRQQSDWNGFVSYSNQVARANTNSDVGYIPFFGNAFLGDPTISDEEFRRRNKEEYATGYDQRHTVAVVANKRISKTFETSLILDAGSGFPFVNDSSLFSGVGSDPQHTTAGNFTEVPVTLFDQQTLQPVNPVVGRSGWHYKISVNSNFYLNESSNLFLNIDNIFNRKTVVNYSTATQAGVPYYLDPTPEYPQGRVYYGPSTQLNPLFVSFGVRTRF